MTKPVSLKNLTEKQRQVWRMRHRNKWRMRRIGLEIGMSASGVSKLLQRARVKAGLPPCRVSVIKTKPRAIRSHQLSEVFYY
jgi:IS30 family transposase